MKIKSNPRKFNTPITVGANPVNPDTNGKKSVDEDIDNWLETRKRRGLDQARLASLSHATEDERREAAQARQERERIERGEKIEEGGEVENTERKVQDAAETAAIAVDGGASPEQAVELGTGKSKVIVVKPEQGEKKEKEGGWSVLNGLPIRDPEGDYTFSQALKVAQLLIPVAPANGAKRTLGEELAAAVKNLEALGIKVGSPAPTPIPAPNRSLKEEVVAARDLLETLGLQVKTDAQAPLKEQVAEAKSLLEGLGLSIGIPGETMEMIQERHRHKEQLEVLKETREHHQSLTEIATSLPERVGRGIASQIVGEESARSEKSDELEYIVCTAEGCGQEIPVPPGEAGSQVTCPKCGTIYSRGETVEPKTE